MTDTPDATVGGECGPEMTPHLHIVSSHPVEEHVGDVVPDDRLDAHAGGEGPPDDATGCDGIVCW
jgi:hypothetical protein